MEHNAQTPSLFVCAGDEYLNEIGVTNPLFPNENCPSGDCAALSHNPRPDLNDDGHGVVAFTDFMRLLAPPPRGDFNTTVAMGEHVFMQIDCGNCHVPRLVTGSSLVLALNEVMFRPFSDFLLHDMGSLGDGIGGQGTASSHEMWTAPLWGLRVAQALLHDGRAATIEAAIEAHDGQAAAARDLFRALEPTKRNRLLAFLRSL